jgi:hypothetical protein
MLPGAAHIVRALRHFAMETEFAGRQKIVVLPLKPKAIRGPYELTMKDTNMPEILIAVVSLTLFLMAGGATLLQGQQAFAKAAEQEAHVKMVGEDTSAKAREQAELAVSNAKANSLLDQAQLIAGAAGIYASEHSGMFPHDVKDLLNGRYVSATVIPDPRISDGTFSFEQKGGAYSVHLRLKDTAVCDAVNRLGGAPGEGQPAYTCVKRADSMTFVMNI